MKKLLEIENVRRRTVMCLAGVFLCGIGGGLMRRAAFGVDPFTSMVVALNRVIPLAYGTLFMVICLLLLVVVLLVDRHYIGLGTVVVLLFSGYVVDMTQRCLYLWFPALTVFARMLLLAVGLVLSCFSASVYFTAHEGLSSYDAIAMILSENVHKTSFRIARIITDLSCVSLGTVVYLFSGGPPRGLFAIVGVGTILSAFFVGPLIDLFNRKFSQPFLNGKLRIFRRHCPEKAGRPGMPRRRMK